MTTSEEIANELSRRCYGEHTHEQLLGGKAKAAEKYPEDLCKAICRGLVNQMKLENMKIRPLMRLTRSDKIEQVNSVDARYKDVDHEDMNREAYDDITGEALDPKEVRRARLTELGYIHDKEVWISLTREEAKRQG